MADERRAAGLLRPREEHPAPLAPMLSPKPRTSTKPMALAAGSSHSRCTNCDNEGRTKGLG